MKKKQWLYLFGLTTYFIFILPSYAGSYAASIDKIILFGDSLSDNGNLYSISSAAHKIIPLVPVVPKDPPYFQGRFSNGPVWIENLTKIMNVELADYAYGGAWVEPAWDSKQLVPFDLNTQVNFYLATASRDFNKEQHLYIIWAGANDYTQGRSDAEYATTNTVSIIQKQIDWLIYYGAKNFLIFNVPDLGVVPEVADKGPEFATAISKMSQLHNDKMASMVASEKQRHPDLKFMLFDITQDFSDIINNPEKYRLKNTKEACYKGDYDLMLKLINSREIQAAKDVKIDILNNASLKEAYFTANLASLGQLSCDNPDEYFFWDHIHPTRIVHQVLSTLVLSALNENGIIGFNQETYK